MSEHQETLDQTVKRIEASFAKVETYSKKVGDHRITAGKLLVELQARIEAGEAGDGVKWWHWYAEHFKNRTRRDATKVMALARSDDPDAAAEEEREKNREAKALQRKREADEQPQPEHTSDSQTWNEEDVAAVVVRDIEHELAARENDGLDLDLVRELIMQKLKFAWTSTEESADARKALYEETETPEETERLEEKKRRPTGSKSKSKEGEDLSIPGFMRRSPEAGVTS
jgi:hypothetical protein